MDVEGSSSHGFGEAPAGHVTGSVRIDPLSQASTPTGALSARITFQPGARTVWHTHPLGQTIIVTAGHGRVQRWGGPIEDIGLGDVIWIAPGEKHWHGAGAVAAMTHIAIQRPLDGKTVEWMEEVADEQDEDRQMAIGLA